jgi:hypothetical protein
VLCSITTWRFSDESLWCNPAWFFRRVICVLRGEVVSFSQP